MSSSQAWFGPTSPSTRRAKRARVMDDVAGGLDAVTYARTIGRDGGWFQVGSIEAGKAIAALEFPQGSFL